MSAAPERVMIRAAAADYACCRALPCADAIQRDVIADFHTPSIDFDFRRFDCRYASIAAAAAAIVFA